MKLHELKIKQEYYEQVFSGLKTFELRKDDRGYEVGDIITFNCISENGKLMFQAGEVYQITYILRDCPEYGLKDGYCILAIKPLEVAK